MPPCHAAALSAHTPVDDAMTALVEKLLEPLEGKPVLVAYVAATLLARLLSQELDRVRGSAGAMAALEARVSIDR